MTITVSLLFLAMPFTDKSGDSHPDAIWYPQSISFNNSLTGGGAGVEWYGYKDVAHFASQAAPIDQIHDSTTAAEYFPAIFQPVAPNTSHAGDTGAVIARLALSHKTVPVLNANGSPQIDPATGLPVMVSPFNGATIVTLPVPITVPG